MTLYSVGDRVEIVADEYFSMTRNGQSGTITAIHDHRAYPYEVRPDNYPDETWDQRASEMRSLLAPVTDISPALEGVWVYAKIDEKTGWSVIPYASEIEALRDLNNNAGGWVRFVPYGTDMAELV